MGRPRFLSENFFNTVQFSGHTVSGNQETAGNEAFRVGTSRRSSLNFWTPTSTNATAYVQAACDRVRVADMLVLDRGHNLAGKTVSLILSNQSSFAASTTLWSFTVPTRSQYGSRLNGPPGAYTEEGAWLYRWVTAAAKYWRFQVSAMGSGLKPKIVGLNLGLSYRPTRAPTLPWDDESRQLDFQQVQSDTLWVGSNRKSQRRVFGPWAMRMRDDNEYTKVRRHIHELYWRGEFMWVVPDEDQAERALLAFAEPGVYSAGFDGEYPQRTLVLSGSEHQPKVR